MLDMNSYVHVLNRICEDVQQKMANKLKDTDEIEWDVNVEILLFYAMMGHKPIGVNRHFMMLFIHYKFSSFINRQISSKVIWDHLDSMYDMAALHESEIVPFPNDEVDYDLPEDCHDIVFNKFGIRLQPSVDENEQPKNNSTSKTSRKLNSSKLKQSSSPVGGPKNSFATPNVNKPVKGHLANRSESKASVVDNSSKIKLESPLPSKINKVKRSSSPFSTKGIKSEHSPLTKEDSPDIQSSKKVSKPERSSSPASTKKLIKVENNSTSNSSKKSFKQDQNVNLLKQGKVEVPDNSLKKVKSERDSVNKKGKVGIPVDHSVYKKSVKLENSNSVKKKNDVENTQKKSSDYLSSKQLKTDMKTPSIPNKGQRLEDVDIPTPPGSRKSSPLVKVETGDGVKKRKRQKLEESAKKAAPAAKRRRT